MNKCFFSLIAINHRYLKLQLDFLGIRVGSIDVNLVTSRINNKISLSSKGSYSTPLFMIRPSLLVLFILFCLVGQIYSQKEICNNIYVWDFTDENGKKSDYTKQITQEVENALTETSCTVLQRRNYAKIAEQTENENAIQSLEGVSSDINQQLQSLKAEVVLFGQVKMDFSSNLMLSVSFQNLHTKEILKSEFIVLSGEESHNINKRQQKILDFISHCVGPKVITNEESTYWSKVQKLNTPEAYVNYIGKYPGGKYRSEAIIAMSDFKVWREIQNEKKTKNKIKKLIKYTENEDALNFEKARSQLEELLWKEEKYEDYVKHFPSGNFIVQANEKIEDKMYENVLRNPSFYTPKYKAKFPNGRYIESINENLEEWLFKEVVDNAFFGAPDYVAFFPKGKYIDKVEDLLWGLVLEKPDGIKSSSARKYLKIFPSGKHAKEAKVLAKR